MHRNFRFARTIGAAVAAALLLAGCSTSAGNADNGSKKLSYMSYWTEGEPTAAVLKQAIADFKKSTGVTVDVQWKGRDLPNALTPLLSTAHPKVDLVDFQCPGSQSVLYSTGHAADLSSVLSTQVLGESKTVAEVIGKDNVATGQKGKDTFCVPYESGSDFDFWFNAARFPELVSSPPKTWDEFEAILAKNGKGSLALDGTIAPYAAPYFVDLVVSATGKGGYLKAAEDKSGKTFIDNPAFLEAAQRVEGLVKAGYFAEGYTASKFPAIQQKWANNTSDFLLVGSWIPAEVAPYAAAGFKYASFAFPAISKGKVQPMQMDTIGFSVLKGAANTDNAKQFIAFFEQKKYQDQMGQLAVPARLDAKTSPNFAGVLKNLNDPKITKIPAGDGVTAAIGPWSQNVGDRLSQKLALGELSAKDFITQIAAASASYWAAQG